MEQTVNKSIDSFEFSNASTFKIAIYRLLLGYIEPMLNLIVFLKQL